MKYTYSCHSQEEARKKAEILQAKMGPHWEIRVHENLGWFYSLRAGNISLSEHGDNDGRPYYSVLIGDRPGTGKMEWSTSYTGRIYDPIEAVKKAVFKAREVTEKNLAMVHSAEAALADSENYARMRGAYATH